MKKNIIVSNLKHIIPIATIIIVHFLAFKIANPIQFDSKEYLSISQNIYANHQFSISGIHSNEFVGFGGEFPTRMRQPLYPLFLSVFYSALGNNFLAVFTAQLLINIISYFLFYQIAVLIFSDKRSRFLNILLALYFPFWMFSATILSETLFSFFSVFSLYIFVKAHTKNDKNLFLISGIILGLSFLTRPIALFIIILLTIKTIDNNFIKNSIKNIVFLLSGFILVISPWVVRNSIVFGDFTALSSDGGYNFYCASLGVNDKPWFETSEFSQIVKDGYYLDRNASNKFIKIGLNNFWKDPLLFVKNGIIRVFETWTYFPGSKDFVSKPIIFFATKIIQLAILLFAFIGYIVQKEKSKINIILIPVIGFTLVILFSHSIARFLIPIMPFVILLSSQGVEFLYSKTLEKLRIKYR